MTIREINEYLDKHFYLIFKYRNEYFSLQKSKALFHPMYSLIAPDKLYQQRESLVELCTQVCINDGILLIDAINYIEIPSWDDPSWETYEAVRHCAIVYKTEIHFIYDGRSYWITHTSDGLSLLSDDLGNAQCFNSCHELFECALIDGTSLMRIWEKVIVDSC